MATEDSFVDIDLHALDREWLRQPKLMYEYGVALADARKEVEEAKNKLEIVRAELDAEIRSDPDAYELAKVTEGAIANAVLQQTTYRRAQSVYLDIKHKVDVLQAAVNAMEHKKRALEGLVSLHGQQYFSEPRASVEDREALETLTKNSVRRRRRSRFAGDED